MSKVLFLLLVLVCAFAASAQDAGAPDVTQGSLFAFGKNRKAQGDCPLKSTHVKTDISGFVARVRVRQEFENSFAEPIEAVYTFPLSQNGAVDDMTMTIGSRTIRGTIMKRDEARKVYEAAKDEGKTASLLDQERPNIFTQSVANIMPGEKIIVEISYVETLKYEDGAYEFVFPMTVGPRYNPASVRDATKIKPVYAARRSGQDISMEVNLNAGVPVEGIRSTSHDIQQVNFAPNLAKVTLKNERAIPNKDFILRYDVTGGKIQDAVLAHRDERGGFFTMILQPPDKVAAEDRTPKEIVFVLDTSGSMSGFPIEKAKEAMKLSLAGLYPEDTFNLITFAGDTEILFPEPVPATQENLERALGFLESRSGGGGTEMMKAIKASLDPSDSTAHLRIVCFMTDGYVGNEEEIIAEVQKHPNARVFSFGIGSSVNRYLLDKIAEAGRGEAEYVSLEDDGSKAARRFYERVRTPLLTDLSIDWNGLSISDTYPSKLTDLFSAKPVVVHGRYTKPVSGKIRLRGRLAGQDYVREIAVHLPESEAANDSLASLWARTRIAELSSEKLRSANAARIEEFDQEILNLGLGFRLMTNFTSFVAVEDRVVNHQGKPTTIQVPVSVPEGVDGGGGGGGGGLEKVEVVANLQRLPSSGAPKALSNGPGTGTAVGYGTGSGSGSGSGNGSGTPPPPSSAAVVVTSGSEVLNTETVTVGTQIQGRQIHATPVQSRDTLSLVTLLPGTSTGIVRTSSITGLPKSALSVQIDGVDVKDNFLKSSDGFFTFIRPRIDSSDGSVFPIEKSQGEPGLYGRAIAVSEPRYPRGIRRSHLKGEVEVRVEIDAGGSVVRAEAMSGPVMLRAISENAAKLTKFARVVDDAGPHRVKGILAYKYGTRGKTEIFIRKMTIAPLTDDDKRDIRMSNVLHFWLYESVMRRRLASGDFGPNELRFVRNGKASIRVQAKGNATLVSKELAAAGMEIDLVAGDVLKGRIPISKLAELAGVAGVKYISPIF